MPPHIVRYPPIQCNTRERCDQLQIPAAPPAWRVPEGPDSLAAVPMGGDGAWPGFEGKLHHTQRHKRRRCGGRRRVRRARAGFEIDHSEPQARVWRSRGRPDPTAPRTPAAPPATKQQGQGAGGPGCGTRGRRRGLAGLRGDTQPHKRRRCGGRRRVRRARAGFEIDHSEPQARVWRSRGQPDPKVPGTLAVPQATKQQGQGVGGPGCGARGRRRGLAGLRDDAPSEARSADGSRAGRRPRAHQAARPSKAHHAGGRTRRRPEHQRRHKQRAPDTRKPRPADAGRGQPTQSGGKV